MWVTYFFAVDRRITGTPADEMLKNLYLSSNDANGRFTSKSLQAMISENVLTTVDNTNVCLS